MQPRSQGRSSGSGAAVVILGQDATRPIVTTPLSAPPVMPVPTARSAQRISSEAGTVRREAGPDLRLSADPDEALHVSYQGAMVG